MNFSLISKLAEHCSRTWMVVILAITLSACVHTRANRTPPPSPTGQTGAAPLSKEDYGPFAAAGTPTPAPTPLAPEYGPEPIVVRPIVLVIGPGLARDLSVIGVIRALHESKIPIGAILGTEIGAVVGALYAADGNINQFEFRLMRFKDDVFEKGSLIGGLFGRSGSGNSKMDSALDHALGDKTIEQFKIPMRVALLRTDEPSNVTIASSGRAADALKDALRVPGMHEEDEKAAVNGVAQNMSRAKLIAAARAMNVGPVVVVDTALPGTLGSADLSSADLVIHIDAFGIEYGDFKRRTDLALSGKRAVQKNMSEIKKWVGLPENGPDVR